MTPAPAAATLRPATPADLDAINAVIGRAVMTWQLPERVKRLALPACQYDAHDLAHLHVVVAHTAGHDLAGVAAWQPADTRDAPAGLTALLVHGLFVDPDHQRAGIGSLLLAAALAAAREQGFDGLLVKARPEAREFFRARGLSPLPVSNPDRDYPLRLWMATARTD